MIGASRLLYAGCCSLRVAGAWRQNSIRIGPDFGVVSELMSIQYDYLLMMLGRFNSMDPDLAQIPNAPACPSQTITQRRNVSHSVGSLLWRRLFPDVRGGRVDVLNVEEIERVGRLVRGRLGGPPHRRVSALHYSAHLHILHEVRHGGATGRIQRGGRRHPT